MRRLPAGAAQIWQMPDFLPPDRCAALIELIDSDLRPSEVFAEGEAAKAFRNSETCDLDDWGGETAPVEERIASLLGIPLEHGEMLQGQRYLPGQHFRAHHDWFEGSQPYWPAMAAQGGQRTFTAMVYLNEVEEGGATWFPRAGIRIRPRPGLLLVWNNMRPDGSPDPDALHEGMQVTAGCKYVLTKWYREGAWTPGAGRPY